MLEITERTRQRLCGRMFNLYLLKHLPLAFFSRLKLKEISNESSLVVLKESWINKNPFGSIYFGALCMAGEFATGILAQGLIQDSKLNISMLLVKIEADFTKKAKGTISFRCHDGLAFATKLQQAIDSKKGTEIEAVSIATNSSGQIVATFKCTWGFILKQK